MFVRLRATRDFASWEQAIEGIVRKCGGDDNALGRNRLMRLAGSVSYPSPQKSQRGYVVELTTAHYVPAPEYSVLDIIAAVPVQTLPKSASFPSVVPGIKKRTGAGPPTHVIRAALRSLPENYAVSQQLWIKVGFALFDFDQGPEGLALWQRFSEQCAEKAQVTNFAKLWTTFARPYSGRRITINWLLQHARKPSCGD